MRRKRPHRTLSSSGRSFCVRAPRRKPRNWEVASVSPRSKGYAIGTKEKRPLASKPLYTSGSFRRLSPAAPAESARSEFRRDYGRLIHSPVFRRLQGKTQLFPGSESDFFRNRLTHSFEVAQVAKGIALQLNQTPFLRGRPIDTDLVELAGLAHDLGHPPFGHNGEHALDDCMKRFGGFEGNAQTLRILSHLEKKVVSPEARGEDDRLGLDLCMRSLAAVLKYDRLIPLRRQPSAKLVKGYYAEEADLVRAIKRAVAGNSAAGKFKTVECYIMDVADDISYSTYDLEDSFKAGFLTPIDLLASSTSILEATTNSINESNELPFKVTPYQVVEVLHEIFSPSLGEYAGRPAKGELIFAAAQIYLASKRTAEDGHFRTAFTSALVNQFIDGVTLIPNASYPMLSVVKLDDDTRLKVEVLKRYTYHAITMSPRLRLVEYRGYEIVDTIFNALAKDKGHHLLPQDAQERFRELADDQARSRLICDYVAGMTDRYAVEFYARIESVNPQTIFKPH
jgi:dGTPase